MILGSAGADAEVAGDLDVVQPASDQAQDIALTGRQLIGSRRAGSCPASELRSSPSTISAARGDNHATPRLSLGRLPPPLRLECLWRETQTQQPASQSHHGVLDTAVSTSTRIDGCASTIAWIPSTPPMSASRRSISTTIRPKLIREAHAHPPAGGLPHDLNVMLGFQE